MIYLKLKGQCPSGKNSVVVTRTGHRFPNKRFVDWRKDALDQINKQYKVRQPIDYPVSVAIKYSSGDLRRRDVPGMIDALWHLLEKANIVTDDKFLGGSNCTLCWLNKGLDKQNPSIQIFIEGKPTTKSSKRKKKYATK